MASERPSVADTAGRTPSSSMLRTIAIALALLLALGCAPRRPAMSDRLTYEKPQAEVGVVQWVESRRIAILVVGAETPRRYLRTQETRVFLGDQEVSWAELRADQAVRFQSVRGPFSPDRVTVVEILQGEEEATVRRHVLADGERSERIRWTYRRNLHVSVGRGS